jgi:hypothetical protein
LHLESCPTINRQSLAGKFHVTLVVLLVKVHKNFTTFVHVLKFVLPKTALFDAVFGGFDFGWFPCKLLPPLRKNQTASLPSAPCPSPKIRCSASPASPGPDLNAFHICSLQQHPTFESQNQLADAAELSSTWRWCT